MCSEYAVFVARLGTVRPLVLIFRLKNVPFCCERMARLAKLSIGTAVRMFEVKVYVVVQPSVFNICIAATQRKFCCLRPTGPGASALLWASLHLPSRHPIQHAPSMMSTRLVMVLMAAAKKMLGVWTWM